MKVNGDVTDAKGVYVKVDGVWQQVATDGPVPEVFNNAEGGTVTTYTKLGRQWRVHTFTGNGELNVLNSVKPFRVFIVGGGGGAQRSPGTGWNSGNGGGGQVIDKDMPVPVDTYAVTVGGGGAGGTGGGASDNEPGGGGGVTKIFNLTATGGGGGGGGGAAYGQTQSDITGASVPYSGNKGAGGGAGTPATYYGEGSGHATGGGGGGGANWSPPGQGGIVIVAYEIAPEEFNDASGGSMNEYVGKDGKSYRSHTFETTGKLTIKKSVKPFKMLLLGGGGATGQANGPGGSGGGGINGAGGGGAGGCINIADQVISASGGPYDIVVGAFQGATTAFGKTAVAGGRGGDGGTTGGSGGCGGGGGGCGKGSDGGCAHESPGGKGTQGGDGALGGVAGPTGYGTPGGNGGSTGVTTDIKDGTNRAYGTGGAGWYQGPDKNKDCNGNRDFTNNQGIAIIAYEIAAPTGLIPDNESKSINGVNVARVTRVDNVVVNVEYVDDEWINQDDNDPWFYFVESPGTDGVLASIGSKYDPDTGNFSEPIVIRAEPQSCAITNEQEK
jgi:hypothetical protein